MQGSRGHEVEVRYEGAKPRYLLDTADQRLVGRIILVDDRGAAPCAIVDNDVDLIPAKPRVVARRFPPGRQLRSRLRRRRAEEVVDIFLDVPFDGVKVFSDFGQ